MKITGRMFLLLHDLKKVKYTQTMEIRVFQNAVEMSGYLCRAYDLKKVRYMDPGKEVGSYLIDGDALKEFISTLYGGMWIEVQGGEAGLVFPDVAAIDFLFLAVQIVVAARAVAEFEKKLWQS